MIFVNNPTDGFTYASVFFFSLSLETVHTQAHVGTHKVQSHWIIEQQDIFISFLLFLLWINDRGCVLFCSSIYSKLWTWKFHFILVQICFEQYSCMLTGLKWNMGSLKKILWTFIYKNFNSLVFQYPCGMLYCALLTLACSTFKRSHHPPSLLQIEYMNVPSSTPLELKLNEAHMREETNGQANKEQQSRPPPELSFQLRPTGVLPAGRIISLFTARSQSLLARGCQIRQPIPPI